MIVTDLGQVLDFVIAAMWTVYAGRGYARHVYYLSPTEIRDALKLSPISRTICIVAIAAGKISVAFLIERIVGPSKWRKWMLRAISIGIAATSFIVVLFFYIQCQPTRAFWDKGLVKMGKGHCWDPIPINRLNLAVASKQSKDCLAVFAYRVDRLLDFPQFRSCNDSPRHCLEAPDVQTEQSLAELVVEHGCLVSASAFHFDNFRD